MKRLCMRGLCLLWASVLVLVVTVLAQAQETRTQIDSMTGIAVTVTLPSGWYFRQYPDVFAFGSANASVEGFIEGTRAAKSTAPAEAEDNRIYDINTGNSCSPVYTDTTLAGREAAYYYRYDPKGTHLYIYTVKGNVSVLLGFEASSNEKLRAVWGDIQFIRQNVQF